MVMPESLKRSIIIYNCAKFNVRLYSNFPTFIFKEIA